MQERRKVVWQSVQGQLLGWLQERWEAGLVDMTGLHQGTRWLIRFGYGIVFFFLFLVLLFELTGSALPQLQFEVLRDGVDTPTLVPTPVLFFSILAFALGWSFILTGASDCRRRIFLPVIALLLVQMLISIPRQGVGTGLALALAFLVIGLTISHLFTRQEWWWQDYPLLEFLLWATLMALYMGLPWLTSTQLDEVAKAFQANVSLLILLVLPFWVWLGIEAVEGVVSLARQIVTTAQQHVREPVLASALFPFLVVRSILPLGLIFFNEFWILDLCFSIPLFLGGILMLLITRWAPRTVLMLFWMAIATFLFTFFLSLALEGNDLNELALGSTGLIPPAMLFTMLLLYDVLTFGREHANVEGRLVPRSGRVLMYLGVVMLFTSFTLFQINLRDPVTGQGDETFQTLVNSIVGLSFLGFGSLYLLWLSWKERERLIPHE